MIFLKHYQTESHESAIFISQNWSNISNSMQFNLTKLPQLFFDVPLCTRQKVSLESEHQSVE